MRLSAFFRPPPLCLHICPGCSFGRMMSSPPVVCKAKKAHTHTHTHTHPQTYAHSRTHVHTHAHTSQWPNKLWRYDIHTYIQIHKHTPTSSIALTQITKISQPLLSDIFFILLPKFNTHYPREYIYSLC